MTAKIFLYIDLGSFVSFMGKYKISHFPISCLNSVILRHSTLFLEV